MKEQGDRTIELIDDMNKGTINRIMQELERLDILLTEANENVNGLDKNTVNRISELLIELQKQTAHQNKQYQTELSAKMDRLEQRVKKGHALLWFLFIFNLISISGIAFLILTILDIIPF